MDLKKSHPLVFRFCCPSNRSDARALNSRRGGREATSDAAIAGGGSTKTIVATRMSRFCRAKNGRLEASGKQGGLRDANEALAGRRNVSLYDNYTSGPEGT